MKSLTVGETRGCCLGLGAHFDTFRLLASRNQGNSFILTAWFPPFPGLVHLLFFFFFIKKTIFTIPSF